MILKKFRNLVLACVLLHSYEVLADIVPLDKPSLKYCTNESSGGSSSKLICFDNDKAISQLEESQKKFLIEKLLLVSAHTRANELEKIFAQPPLKVGQVTDIPFQGVSYKSQSYTWWAGDSVQLSTMERLKKDGAVVVLIVNGLVLTARVNYGIGKFLEVEYSSTPCIMNCK